jgi:hypothetical protein
MRSSSRLVAARARRCLGHGEASGGMRQALAKGHGEAAVGSNYHMHRSRRRALHVAAGEAARRPRDVGSLDFRGR